ncbi:MAG: HEAT repeat domain-containing protein [Planctomycetota bacterium]
MGKLKTAVFVVLLLGVLCTPLIAGTRAVYNRPSVSIGALSKAAPVVFRGEAVSVLNSGKALSVVCRVDETFKGPEYPEVMLEIGNTSWNPEGKLLFFAVPNELGSFYLVGGSGFGAVRLSGDSKAVIDTLKAHLEPADGESKAKILMNGFKSTNHRLQGDAVVDLYREPSLLVHLTARDKGDLLAAMEDEASRANFRSELPYFIALAGHVGGNGAFDALCEVLTDPHTLCYASHVTHTFSKMDVKSVVANLLDRFGKEKGAGALPGLITALAGLKAEEARDRISSLTRHGDGLVRKFAVLGMGDLGGEPSVTFLGSMLDDRDRPMVERKLAVVALAQTGLPSGIRAICKAEETDDQEFLTYIRKFRRFPARTRALLIREIARTK